MKTVTYTVCRPVQETCYKTCAYTVCRPGAEDLLPVACPTRCRCRSSTTVMQCQPYTEMVPVQQCAYKQVAYTVCRPVRETVMQECRYTVQTPGPADRDARPAPTPSAGRSARPS